MPIYEYRCECRVKHLECSPDDPTKHLYDSKQVACESCSTPFRRRFGFSTPAMMHEHYNPALGRTVSSRREMREAAKVASAEATERTGILHDYQPVDLRDPSVAPDSDDGLQSQHDRAVEEGRRESKGRFVHTIS